MKIATSQMQALLSSNDVLVAADFWVFTLKNGTVLNYTTWDTDVVISGTTRSEERRVGKEC